jgi:hypothetical protein
VQVLIPVKLGFDVPARCGHRWTAAFAARSRPAVRPVLRGDIDAGAADARGRCMR